MQSTQGELEHRKPKARYKRTNKQKVFVKQLARIERREARLRSIRAKLADKEQYRNEPVASTPQEHHHIGTSQNHFEHVGMFLQRHSGDPAVKVGVLEDTTGSQVRLSR
jgi:hypothetical protein